MNYVWSPYEVCIKVDTESWNKDDTKLINNFLIFLCRLRMNFTSKFLQKVDSKLIHNIVSTLFQLRMKLASKLIRKVETKSWYKVDTQRCINFVSTPYELCIKNDTNSWYKVDTQLRINFLSTPYELRIEVDTISWYKVDEKLLHNFVSILCRLRINFASKFTHKVDTKLIPAEHWPWASVSTLCQSTIINFVNVSSHKQSCKYIIRNAIRQYIVGSMWGNFYSNSIWIVPFTLQWNCKQNSVIKYTNCQMYYHIIMTVCNGTTFVVHYGRLRLNIGLAYMC